MKGSGDIHWSEESNVANQTAVLYIAPFITLDSDGNCLALVSCNVTIRKRLLFFCLTVGITISSTI